MMENEKVRYTEPDMVAKMDQKIAKSFTYQEPDDDERDMYIDLLAEFKGLASAIDAVIMPSREKSLAITKLQEASFWVRAAIEGDRERDG